MGIFYFVEFEIWIKIKKGGFLDPPFFAPNLP
jgi:hypothetical protein